MNTQHHRQMPPSARPSVRRSTLLHARGFSLVEVTVALGLASFGLVAIMGLLPSGLSADRDSLSTTVAAQLASALVVDLETPAQSQASLVYGISPDAASPTDGHSLYLKADGTQVKSAIEADYIAHVIVTPPKVSPNPTQVRVTLSWPAAAAKPASSFEVVTAINRS